MNKTIYVFGHKNPDTDSVVSATAFAALKNLSGDNRYKAARAGKLNPQTEYIYKKFGVAPPDFIPDLNPKVAYYMNDTVDTVQEMSSLWNATSVMKQNDRKVLLVVDEQGKYKAMLNYNSLARNVFEILNPEHHIVVSSSIQLICETLNGQIYCGTDRNSVQAFTILASSSRFDSFKQTIDMHIQDNLLVVAGDREDVQRLCIEKKVKALILSGGRIPSPDVVAAAEQSGTSIVVSPYDTASTSMLIVYSAPVTVMSEHSVQPVLLTDSVQKVKILLKENSSRLLPVVDNNGTVVGVIGELELHREANIGVSLVDHNEFSQAVDGVDNYTIYDIIDHHRIGTMSTKFPISFMNLPVGSTSTIIVKLFRDQNIDIPEKTACLLLCGILSDTLILQSATTTEIDRKTAEYLAKLTGQDIKNLGEEILKAGSRIGSRTPYEVVNQDMKEYRENDCIFTVSQIEVDGYDEIIGRKNEFLDELEIARRSHAGLFSALLVTNITTLNSIMLIAGDEKFLSCLHFPKQEEHVCFMKGVVSRKKQLIPVLSELLDEFTS